MTFLCLDLPQTEWWCSRVQKRVREVRTASLARLISSYDEDPELCETSGLEYGLCIHHYEGARHTEVDMLLALVRLRQVRLSGVLPLTEGGSEGGRRDQGATGRHRSMCGGDRRSRQLRDPRARIRRNVHANGGQRHRGAVRYR